MNLFKHTRKTNKHIYIYIASEGTSTISIAPIGILKEVFLSIIGTETALHDKQHTSIFLSPIPSPYNNFFSKDTG